MKTVEGKFQWNEWNDCSVSCGGGFQTKIVNSCVPDYAICFGIQIIEQTCNNQECPIGQWIWNDWSECTASCGGGMKFKTAQSCEPVGADCTEVPVLKEKCNQQNCPHMPSQYIPEGTIISWVPRPNKNSPENHSFNDDTWIECNGFETCKRGRFAGQVCSDMSDRVLVGAGRLGQILDLKDASLPDHAHSHTHDGLTTGVHNYQITYRTGPKTLRERTSGMGGSSAGSYHDHERNENINLAIDFGRMNPSEAFVSRITNPKVSISSAENELYSPHMRVKFMFKCH